MLKCYFCPAHAVWHGTCTNKKVVPSVSRIQYPVVAIGIRVVLLIEYRQMTSNTMCTQTNGVQHYVHTDKWRPTLYAHCVLCLEPYTHSVRIVHISGMQTSHERWYFKMFQTHFLFILIEWMYQTHIVQKYLKLTLLLQQILQEDILKDIGSVWVYSTS